MWTDAFSHIIKKVSQKIMFQMKIFRLEIWKQFLCFFRMKKCLSWGEKMAESSVFRLCTFLHIFSAFSLKLFWKGTVVMVPASTMVVGHVHDPSFRHSESSVEYQPLALCCALPSLPCPSGWLGSQHQLTNLPALSPDVTRSGWLGSQRQLTD